MEPDSNSGDTGSESPPPPPPPPNPNGRITVTIAAPPLERGVTLALPIQPRIIGTSNGTGTAGGREDCWSEGIPILQTKQFGTTFVSGGGGGGGEVGGIGSGGGSGAVAVAVAVGGRSSGSGGGGGIGGNGGGGGGVGGSGGSGRIVAIGGGGGGGREDCWSDGATEVLIEAWGERYVELKRGNLRQNHWKEVADIVSSRDDYSKTPKTDNQCKNRIDTVKKKYKTEKERIALSGGRSSWRFYDRMEELVGPLPKPYGAVFATGYEGGKNVPVGIPVGVRTMPVVPQFREPETLKRKMKMDPVDYDSGEERYERKKAKMMERGSLNRGTNGNGNGNGKRSWGESVRELSRAIMGLGEAYQEAESMKLEQLMEMEKHRMQFAKELELQRMKFMTQTQIEISHMKRKMKEQQSHKK